MNSQVESKISQLLENGYKASFESIQKTTTEVVKGIFLYSFLAIIIYSIGTWILGFFVDLMVPMAQLDAQELQSIIEGNNPEESMDYFIQNFSKSQMYIPMFLSNIISVVLYPILYSIIWMAYKYDHHKSVVFEDIFHFYRNGKFVNIVLVTLVIQILASIGLFLCLLPGVILYISWMLAIPLVIFADADLKEALTYSLKLAFKDFGTFLLIILAIIVLSIICVVVGVLLCCVGLLFTLPLFYVIVYVINYALYKEIVGFPGELSEIEEIGSDIYKNNPYMNQ